MSTCQLCSAQYEVTDFEREIRKKVAPIIKGETYDFPDSPFCPNCRQQRRCSFRNDRQLFRRTCSKTGETILSTFRNDVPFPVYNAKLWWSDEWDAKDYGQDFDFSRPFFAQFEELLKKVPRQPTVVFQSENCDYTIFCGHSRNCYLSSRVIGEDILYSYLAINSNTCMDCYAVDHCELNYECINNTKCYHCIYTELAENCSDLMFCTDMKGCRHCFGCVGLIQKEYHFFNERLSKEEYEKKVAGWWDGSHEAVERIIQKRDELRNSLPQRNLITLNCENSFGGYLFNCKNIWNSFDVIHCEDGIYCTQSDYVNTLGHCDFPYRSELCYEMISSTDSSRIAFTFGSYSSSELYYSVECTNQTSNCFGCIGLKKGQYCILNKQYTKEEYEVLLPRIIDHMKSTGEWGIFFPPELSGCTYNDSVAHDRFPLTKEQALAGGWKWGELEEIIPDSSNAEICPESGRPFRHVKAEVEFCKKMKVPLPRLHPDIRHAKRLARRRPYRLHPAQCDSCQSEIWTDLETKGIIYCEDCYRKAVY